MHDGPTSPWTTEQRNAILRFVREVARSVLEEPCGAAPDRPTLPGRHGGAFVTLYRGKVLRGCVGTLCPTDDLAATLADVTGSALADPRFTSMPVTRVELDDLTIEVSLLSEPVRAEAPLSLVPGRHGIVVRGAGHSGCFLPKVAVEHGWSAEEFLSQCCVMKAGLPADAWKDAATQVYIFTAEVFSDTALRVRATT